MIRGHNDKSEYEARMSVGVKNNDSSKSGEAI